MFKIKLSDSKAINDSGGIKVSSRKNSNNNDSNSGSKKSKKKLTKSKIGNLAKFKKIARNGIMEIRLNFLIPAIKKIFN